MSAGKPSLDNTDKASSIVTTMSSSKSTAITSIQDRPSADTNSTLTVEGSTTTSSSTTEGETAQSQDSGPPTFFGTISRSYADVPITEDGVDTNAFLEASEGLLALFDLLGPTAFGLVVKDMSSNINKIRNRFLVAPLLSGTLEKLVENEAHEPKRTASEGLMWLLRGLEFTCMALRRSQEDHNEELAQSFTKAYEKSLRQYHNRLIRPLFAIAMKACPLRQIFYARLGPAEAVNIELNAWLTALSKIVERVQAFYQEGNYAKGF